MTARKRGGARKGGSGGKAVKATKPANIKSRPRPKAKASPKPPKSKSKAAPPAPKATPKATPKPVDVATPKQGPVAALPDVESLQFPIGRFKARMGLGPGDLRALIHDIAGVPGDFGKAVRGLAYAQLDTPYRPGGWTVRQVVNHVADSHMNGYIRFKLAVTEEEPAVKPYKQAVWAETADGRTGDVEVSLRLLEALHDRWVRFLRSLQPPDFQRPLRHPELGRVVLEWYLQLYQWHGRHHLAHVLRLREREGW